MRIYQASSVCIINYMDTNVLVNGGLFLFTEKFQLLSAEERNEKNEKEKEWEKLSFGKCIWNNRSRWRLSKSTKTTLQKVAVSLPVDHPGHGSPIDPRARLITTSKTTEPCVLLIWYNVNTPTTVLHTEVDPDSSQTEFSSNSLLCYLSRTSRTECRHFW